MRCALYVLGLLTCLLLVSCTRDPKVLRERCVANGNKYFKNGKYKQASILYRRALQLDPKYPEAYYRLGIADIELHDLGSALNAFLRAYDLDPTNEDAGARAAEIFLGAYVRNPQNAKQALAEARTLVERILSRNPKSYDGLRLDADLATALNDRERAIQRLNDANAVKPWQPGTIVALMESLAMVGRQAQAEALGQAFLKHDKTYGPVYDLLYLFYLRTGQFDQAESILKAKTVNLPSDPFSRVGLAVFYFSRGRKSDMLAMLDQLRSDPKTFPQADDLIADFFIRIGDFDAALQALRDAEKKYPKSSATYERHIAEILIAQGHPDQAMQIATKLHKQYPNDVEAASIHAFLLAKGNEQEIQAAINELESYITKQPGNATLQLNLGRIYIAKGDRESLDVARQHIETSVKLNPNFLPAKLALAEVEAARGRDRESEQIAEEILAQNPANLQAKVMRASALAKLGELQKAREELLSILKNDKDSKDARYWLALVDFAQKHFADAEAGFMALVRAGDLRGITGIARSKEAQGQPAAAVQLLQRELEKFPDREDYRLALADVEYRSGRLTEARAELERLATKNPRSVVIQLRLGDVRNRVGDLPGALQSFRKAHELNPSNITAALDMAVMLHATGQTEQARAAYQDVLRVDPENVQALNNLAYIKAEEGVDLDQALGLVQRALRHSPNDAAFSDTLGLIYIRKKLTGQALQIFQDLVARAPDNPSFHMHFGMALYDAGEKQHAKKEFESALQHKPSATEEAKIKELVARIG